jgi:hypothetical protein
MRPRKRLPRLHWDRGIHKKLQSHNFFLRKVVFRTKLCFKKFGFRGLNETIEADLAASMTPRKHIQRIANKLKIFHMHAVSMTPHARCMQGPHAKWNFRKVKIIGEMALLCKQMKNAFGVIDTACKIWHGMHNRRTIPASLAAFKGNI